MQSPVGGYLAEVLETCGGVDGGEPAQYIPELADADPSLVAAAIATIDGEVYTAGDAEHEFTIQSMSKAFAYAFALEDAGFEAVADKVDVEPSGDPFNELSLDPESGRPKNPMINAGAITTHWLLGGDTPQSRVERVRTGLSEMAGRELSIDENVYASELDTAHRNLALGHMLRSTEIITDDPVEVVSGYVRQCSILVNTRDIAVMAATLATGGIQPLSGERVLHRATVRQVLSVMLTSGMYDSAGDWMTSVGIPAKSGVAGGILGALPGQVGIGAFAPPLDAHGNSVRGVSIFERLSTDMGMHLMDGAEPSRNAVEAQRSDGELVYLLQGSMRFASAERFLRMLEHDTAGNEAPQRIVIDLDHAHSLDETATRMVMEAIRRLRGEGRQISVNDPDDLLPSN